MANTRKKQTLEEFKAWLDGVEEMQPAGWIPDATQWKLIRKRIKGIVIDQPSSRAQEQALPVKATPMSSIMPPPVPSRIPDVEPMITPEAQRLLGEGKSSTPDIDTSDGKVTSSFE